MKFLENAEKVYTSEPFYDLSFGGYIVPDKMLEPEDAEKVNEAVETIQTFFREAEAEGVLELI